MAAIWLSAVPGGGGAMNIYVVSFLKELMVRSGRVTQKETVLIVGGREKLIITRLRDKYYEKFKCYKEGASDLALGTEKPS